MFTRAELSMEISLSKYFDVFFPFTRNDVETRRAIDFRENPSNVTGPPRGVLITIRGGDGKFFSRDDVTRVEPIQRRRHAMLPRRVPKSAIITEVFPLGWRVENDKVYASKCATLLRVIKHNNTIS